VKIEKIYIDMDGVLTDCWGSFRDEFGIDPTYNGPLSAEDFFRYTRRDPKFWSDMPWTKDGKDLYDILVSLQIPLHILSAPPENPKLDPNVVAGKITWILREIPDMNIKNIHIDFNKSKYANPNSILIDDQLNNIESWTTAGGIAIHHKDIIPTILTLKGILVNDSYDWRKQ
jgi:5'(3')-deoxyribonucleotidase